MEQQISSFSGQHRWLSNFWLCEIAGEDGLMYPAVENYYQAHKTLLSERRQEFCDLSPGASKHRGKLLTLRPDWERVRVDVMRIGIYRKFWDHPELAEKLLATGSAELIEGNTWGDTFWGTCRGRGANILGKILMDMRELLRSRCG